MYIELSLVSVLFLEVVFFCGYLEQQISGFGATLFCLPFALMVLPRELFVPLGLAYTLMQSLKIAWEGRRSIQIKQLLIVLASASIVGIPLADVLLGTVEEHVIKCGLAAFILAYSLLCLWNVWKGKGPGVVRWYDYAMPVASGVMQTAYGVGGPLLVAYLSKTIMGKTELRATICGYWVVLNSVILCKYFYEGAIYEQTVKIGICLLPAVLLGVWMGNKLVNRISQKKFTILIYCVLMASAGFLLL